MNETQYKLERHDSGGRVVLVRVVRPPRGGTLPPIHGTMIVGGPRP
jgi:hypothetical protein